ncbi:MAG: tetratricopeptide repeat protein [Gammaproteobacteria bacterium]|jgi:predicted negative regulator of RcsB-dependent stress response
MVNETEEQQIAELKKWWSDNGTSIIVGVALGLACVFGYRSWLAYQDNLSGQASTIYSVMLQGVDRDDVQLVNERADILITQYNSTPYAALAALALAKMRIEEGELDAAGMQLQWVLDNGDLEVVRDIARLRLARVLIAQQKLDAAEALLQQPRSTAAFDKLYHEITGDIFSARDDAVAASEAYQRALAATPANNTESDLLRLKYENVLAISNVKNEVAK